MFIDGAAANDGQPSKITVTQEDRIEGWANVINHCLRNFEEAAKLLPQNEQKSFLNNKVIADAALQSLLQEFQKANQKEHPKRIVSTILMKLNLA